MRQIVWCSAILMMACNSEDSTTDFDPIRKKYNLPTLDSTWYVLRKMDGVTIWKPLLKTHSGHTSKLVFERYGKVFREENVFVGYESYETIDGGFTEELHLSGEFLENGQLADWDCKYLGKEHPFGIKITPERADSILKKWKFSIN